MTSSDDAVPDPVVGCADVTRIYGAAAGKADRTRTAVTALDEVSISVSAGEFVALAGPSGSGKSTLLHLLAGLDTPTTGTVTLLGENVSTLSERARARLRLSGVGIVFQRFHLLPALSARANVALPLVERGLRKDERRTRAEALLDRVGLADRAKHRPGELSGGEQQRVAVARALANDPALVIADEPTGELDTETGDLVIDLLGDIATDRGVIVASHDDAVIDACNRVIRLRDGQVVTDE